MIDRQMWVKKILPAVGAGVVGAIILVGGLRLYKSYKRVVVVPNKPILPTSVIPPTATPTPDADADFSVALLGYAGGDHDGAGLTDSILVARVQPKKERILMISIPRDLWVKLPLSTIEGEEHWYKINAAFVLGGDDKKYPNKAIEYTGEAGGGMVVKSVLGEVLGMPIDYFVAVDFSGFMSAIDNLGGINVYVARSFEDPFYPIKGAENETCGKSVEEITAIEATMSGWKLEQAYECRFETLKFEKGLVEMSGELALKYVRSRHSPTDGGDFNRARRQREVIEAVKNKVISIGFLPKVIPLISQLSWHIQTDIDLEKMNEWVNRFDQFSNYEIENIALTTENVLMDSKSSAGQFILTSIDGIGYWNAVQEYIDGVVNETVLDSENSQ